MTAATVRAFHVGARASPAVGTPMAGDLEVPRPLRLVLTAGWNLAESGLPVAVYAVAAWAGGRNAGLIAGLVAIWLMAVIRKVVTGSVPSLLTISAVVLTVQAAVVLATGELWLFLLQFPLANLCMCVLFARTASGPDPLVARLAAEVVALRQPPGRHPGLHRFFQGATWLWAGIFLLLAAVLAVLMVTEPAGIFLMLSTAVTVALVVAGTGASALWFCLVLRRLGLRLCFAQPEPGRRAGSPLDTSVPAIVRQRACAVNWIFQARRFCRRSSQTSGSRHGCVPLLTSPACPCPVAPPSACLPGAASRPGERAGNLAPGWTAGRRRAPGLAGHRPADLVEARDTAGPAVSGTAGLRLPSFLRPCPAPDHHSRRNSAHQRSQVRDRSWTP
jgi:uncharacterized membrane protein